MTEEFFTRVTYFGLAHLHLSLKEIELMRFGLIMDLIECHMQYNGIKQPYREITIDDVIPI